MLFQIFDGIMFLVFPEKFSHDVVQIPSERNEQFNQSHVGKGDDGRVRTIRYEALENVETKQIQGGADQNKNEGINTE